MIFDTHAHYDDEAFDGDREELLESGVQMAIGQQAMLEEVTILPLVAYEDWLRKLAELEAAQ